MLWYTYRIYKGRLQRTNSSSFIDFMDSSSANNCNFCDGNLITVNPPFFEAIYKLAGVGGAGGGFCSFAFENRN